ncbi:MAG: ASCH domain-containing protein [Anaerolineae bacterium]|nr:ASCH domain-containing protein [Anaerolineae bacterium]
MLLSVRQPWAWLIIHGGKDIENRSWRTNVRGRILIHASRSMEYSDEEAAEVCREYCVEPPPTFDRGGVIGSIEIVDCVTDHESSWFEGEYGFVLSDPQPLPFYPCSGRVGFFDVDLAAEAAPPPTPTEAKPPRKPGQKRRTRPRSPDDIPIPGFGSWEEYERAMRVYKEAEATREQSETDH